MTLVIMAAGMGSRFGGLKQIEPVGPNGEFIIDYSIYDAIEAGFNKVVFIIKEENYDIFKDTIGKRIENKIDVEYVFQDIKNIPEGIVVPSDRIKPWGTAHAILSCRGVVNEKFTIINADDFYGKDAYKTAYSHNVKKLADGEYAMVGYSACNTLTDSGSVKRGYIEENDGYLSKMIECSVERENGKIKFAPIDGSEVFYKEDDTKVSMNMFCLDPSIIEYIYNNFKSYLEKNYDNINNCEYLIQDAIFAKVKENEASVKVLTTTAVWHGVTYKEDKEDLVNYINNLIENGEYPNNLY